jgi:methylglutaconyl-CoA hydratase
MIFAAEEARFGFTQVKIGFAPAIVMKIALRRLNEPNVRRLALIGGMIDAAETPGIGLISEIVDDSEIKSWSDNF